MSCEIKPDGNKCPEIKDKSCNPFDLTKLNDNCFIDSVVGEALAIGGADLRVFKLLGVHEQGKLIDLTGTGQPISNGDQSGFEAENAFDTFISNWRSSQVGSNVLSSFIGYDFGEFNLDEHSTRYGIETFVKHNIALIKIKQGDNPQNRIVKARVERSPDGVKWYGVSLIDLPDDNILNTIKFKHSVPSRFWRIRPLTFSGGSTDPWIVQALELHDYDETSIEDIQDQIFLENRDRDYADESVTIKGTYDLIDIQTELSKFGIELPSQQYYMHIHFNASVTSLGRPIVIGDILEVPSEVQYSPSMEPIKKFLEVTDVGWSTDGYTPGWQPTLQRIIAQPMLASQETQDIFGGMAPSVDDLGLLDMNDGNHPIFQDMSEASQTFEAEETTQLPERGTRPDVHEFTEEEIDSAAEQGVPDIQKIGLNPRALYVEDGLPPNDSPYTEGDVLPTDPTDGIYHRLTYSGLSKDIPPRLFRYSVAKNRWIYLETDKRSQFSATKPILQEFLSSSTRVSNKEIK